MEKERIPILYLSEKEKNWAIAVYPNGEVCLLNTEFLSREKLEKEFCVKRDGKKFSQLFKGFFLSQTG